MKSPKISRNWSALTNKPSSHVNSLFLRGNSVLNLSPRNDNRHSIGYPKCRWLEKWQFPRRQTACRSVVKRRAMLFISAPRRDGFSGLELCAIYPDQRRVVKFRECFQRFPNFILFLWQRQVVRYGIRFCFSSVALTKRMATQLPLKSFANVVHSR